MNKQTGICPGMHALCFLRSVWLWLSLSMTHCHTLLHTSSLRRQTPTPSNPFALTHTQTERHFTDTLHEGNRHSTAWEPMSHHVAFRVFQRLIRHSCWQLVFFFFLSYAAVDRSATFGYASLQICLTDRCKVKKIKIGANMQYGAKENH